MGAYGKYAPFLFSKGVFMRKKEYAKLRFLTLCFSEKDVCCESDESLTDDPAAKDIFKKIVAE